MVGWIFVFETPFHLQKFVRFIREAKGELDDEIKSRNNSNVNQLDAKSSLLKSYNQEMGIV